jgi:methyltransferase (TIGR00027 family)
MKTIYSRTVEKADGFQFARWSAGAKAVEDQLPEAERVIHDPLARWYAGRAGMGMVARMQAINPTLRRAIALRARYFDDEARRCLREGCEQVVLIGAGYDSRFLRLPEFRRIRIYELDLASTQAVKKAATRRLLGGLPPNVSYVTADLSRQAVTDRLRDAGFLPQRRTLFVWEGVSLFLNRDIIEETLGRLAGLGAGHRLVFDFVPPELVENETGHRGNRELLRLCAEIGEPLTFGCAPGEMTRILAGAGYDDVRIVGLSETSRLYGGTDRIEDCYCFATAGVAGPARGAAP